MKQPAGIAARAAQALSGLILGLVLGLVVSLAIVVYEARVQHRYVESTSDVIGWRALPIPGGALGGAVAGWSAPVLLAAASAGGIAGGGMGAVVGAVAGGALSDRRSGPWAGGIWGSALGVLIGIGGGLVWARARWRRRRRAGVGPARQSRLAGLLSLAAAVVMIGCGGETPPLPEVPPAPPPGGDDVESVFLLFGDPGRARYLKFPILPRMTREVEHWSAQLEDSAVVVVALGDIIYPDGMSDPGTDGYATDSLRVESQAEVVGGANARARGARMFFVAGNHDWGLKEHRQGTRHLKNLGRFLDRLRARGGPPVDLVPEAGTGMPYVVDVGGVRLILLDTAWWIFDAEPHRKEEMVERLAESLASAGDREVIVAAHHPYATAGPHGGEATVWKNLGIRRLLARSGAMLQSLDSRVYAELRAALEETFARVGRPLVYVGGHEHSLQVIRHDSATAPRYSLVSGSASKVTPVGWTDGMLYSRSAPGYMRILVRESGAVDLYLEAAPDRYLLCRDDETAEMDWRQCMAEGIETYQTVFSMRLSEGDAP